MGSEAESFSSVTEQRVKGRPIQAQSAVIARAMARICNDDRTTFCVIGGHERKTLRLTIKKTFCIAKRTEIGRFSANNGRRQGLGMLSGCMQARQGRSARLFAIDQSPMMPGRLQDHGFAVGEMAVSPGGGQG